MGIMNANVAVNFVVNEPEPLVEEESEQDPDGGLAIEPLEMTAYENEVHSDHIVLMMGYQLRALEQGDVTSRDFRFMLGIVRLFMLNGQSKAGRVGLSRTSLTTKFSNLPI